MSQSTIPAWALQRVRTAVVARNEPRHSNINPTEVARQTGLSKSLVRQCLFLLKRT